MYSTLKKILAGILIFFAIFFIGYFSFRDYALKKILESQANKLEEKYNVQLTTGNVNFKGISGLYFKTIVVSTTEKDTILTADSVYLKIRLLPLLAGKKRFSNFDAYDVNIKLIKKGNVDNFTRFFKNRKKTEVEGKQYSNFSDLMNSMLGKIFGIIPSKISLKHLNLSTILNSGQTSLYVPNFKLHSGKYYGSVVITSDEGQNNCLIDGNLESSKRIADFNLSSADSKKLIIPFVKAKYDARVEFDNLHLSFKDKGFEGGLLNLNGKSEIAGLMINHKKLAPTDILLKKGLADFNIRIGDRSIELDSSSVIGINQISFNPYIRYEANPNKQLSLKILRKEFNSLSFFESLPKGMFNSLEGMLTEGDLIYHLNFYVDFHHPANLVFDSRLEKKNFRIVHFGKTNFSMINGNFYHEVYEKNKLVRAFMVGDVNPNYVHLDQISSYLKNAVLTCEDPAFFLHHGFSEEAFRKSIATDIIKKRFARGGSTISMQLVKNVFLSRNKTVSRKMEEALIVWLIENMHLSTKSKMFEDYLNLIEWGPGIYGVTEASNFYFNKRPADLNLTESIFLASIIPHPKTYKFCFDSTGQLRLRYQRYFSMIRYLMLRRREISSEDTANNSPWIDLRGRAREMVVSHDTIAADTTENFDTIID